MWSHSGAEIFYHQAPGKILAVPVSPVSTFEAGTPKVIISGNYLPTLDGRHYDETPDGRRFVIVKNVPDTTSAPTELVVVLNWFEELKARVPTK